MLDSAIFIEAQTGDVCLGPQIRLKAGQAKSIAEPTIAGWLAGSVDYGNGYEWLTLRGLSFGGEKAALSLCFHEGLLKQIAWSVSLPNESLEGGWPTKEAIDNQLSFVRKELGRQLHLRTGQVEAKYDWGTVWSVFDAKGFLASNGVRYELG